MAGSSTRSRPAGRTSRHHSRLAPLSKRRQTRHQPRR
jgi:hypothetical protein